MYAPGPPCGEGTAWSSARVAGKMPITIARLNTDPHLDMGIVSKRDADEGKVPFQAIDATQFELMSALFSANPDVRAAFEAIERGLFAGRVILTGVRVDPVTEGHIQREYVALASACICDILRYGFTLVTFNRETGLPFTIPPSLVTIQHRSVIGGPSEYRVTPAQTAASLGHMWQHTSAGQPRPFDDVIVFEKNAPDAGGHLTSPISALMSMEVFRHSMRQQAAIAWRALANPAMVTVSKETSVAEETFNRDMRGIGESDALALQTADVMDRARAMRERRQMEMREQLTAEMNARRNGPGGAADQARRALYGASLTGGLGGGALQLDPLTRAPLYSGPYGSSPADDIPIMSLPTNHDVRPAPVRQAPQGLADADETAESDVAKIMGVPTAMWAGQRRAAVATNQTALTTFYSTLQMWRADLGVILHPVLMFAFGDLRLEQLREFTRLGGCFEDEVSESDGGASDSEDDSDGASASSGELREGDADDSDGDMYVGRRIANRRLTRARPRRHSSKRKRPSKRTPGAGTGEEDASARTLDAGERDAKAAGTAGAAEGARQAVAQREKVLKRNKPTGSPGEGGEQKTQGAPRKRLPRKRARRASRFTPNEDLSITFPALLDQPMIERLHEIGAVKWDTAMDFLSSYLGVDRSLLSDKQLEAATGLSLAEETKKSRKREQEAADMSLDATEQKMKLDAKAAKDASAVAKAAAAAPQAAAKPKPKPKPKAAASSSEPKKADSPKKPKKKKSDSKGSGADDSDSGDSSSSSDDSSGPGGAKQQRETKGAKGAMKKRPNSGEQTSKTGKKLDRSKNPGK